MGRVLVTGASGHIGGALCRRLSTEGAEVHGVSRAVRNTQNGPVRWWRADLRSIEAVRGLINTVRPDLIFHLAGCVSGKRDLELVLPTLDGNLQATVNVLVASTEASCGRVILAGSLEEPDDNGPAVCSSPYAASKWTARAYARMFHALYHTPVVIARIFMVYGPGPQPLTRLVPYVISSLLSGEAPRLTSGTRPVDWIYIDDVVEGLLACASVPSAVGETIDLGSGCLTEVRSVALQIAQLMGAKLLPEFGALADREMEQTRAANVHQSYKLLGWQPRTALDTGLRATIAWFKTQNLHRWSEPVL